MSSSYPSIMSSRVRLARNYPDLPFDLSKQPEQADSLIARTNNAVMLSGIADEYDLIRLGEMTGNQRDVLVESPLISRDLLSRAGIAAVLLNRKESVSIMMNEEDHLRIQAIMPGMALQEAAEKCFYVDDALSRQVEFAFDEQLGYLTALPINTGTGMRASLLLHLPMLTQYKQMGTVGQTVAKVGLTIRGVYGEGSDALGCIYQISNQVTLGRTEQEIINNTLAVGHQLTDMERALREKAFEQKRALMEDTVYRAMGIMSGARLMPQTEFFRLWSSLRVGAVQGLVKILPSDLDDMLDQVLDAHLRAYMEQDLEGSALNEIRATRIRQILSTAVKKRGVH